MIESPPSLPARETLDFSRVLPKASAAPAILGAIMAGAGEIFLHSGFENASMEAIAARAGVTKKTLYKRFADKRSLLRAVLRERRVQ